MKKKNFLMLFLSAGLITATFAQEAKTQSAAPNTAGNVSQKNYAVEHAREVDQKMAAEKAARQAKTAELQKQHAVEVENKVKAQNTSPMQPPAQKPVENVKPVKTAIAPAKSAAKTASNATVPASTTGTKAVNPRRDESAAQAKTAQLKAEKKQGGVEQKSATKNVAVKTEPSPASGNAKVTAQTRVVAGTSSGQSKAVASTHTNLTNDERVAQMNERNAAVQSKEHAAAAGHSPVKPAQKNWPKDTKTTK